MRSRLRELHRRVWIDALIGALALAAVGAALLVDPILASTGGSLTAVATNLTYPLADVLIIGLIVGAFAVGGWRLDRTWRLIALAWALQLVCDWIWLYKVASGTYEFGTVLDAAFPVPMLLVCAAAWLRPGRPRAAQATGWAVLVVPTLFAVVALGLATYDSFHDINDVAVGLATATLLAAFVRTAETFANLRSVASSRDLLARQALILDSAGEGIYGSDSEGRMTFVNAAAARMTGHDREQLLGRSSHDVLHHHRADETPYPEEDCPVLASLRQGTVNHVADEVYWRADGTSFPVEYTSTPIVENGEVTGAVVVFRDITERLEVDRLKSEFVSVVSHELRTPLTSIRGSLGLLAGGALGELPERAQRMVDIAADNTDRLVRLINDILDIERMESGRVTIQQRRCDVAMLVEQAIDVMRPMARDAGIDVAAQTTPLEVWADSDRLLQTLTNLLSNAIRFSPAGTTVRVTAQAHDGEVLFGVHDRGRGIPSDKLDTIFEPFEQVDSSDARERGGTGLGLAICRAIVEQHGGRIWADSTVGEGTTVAFTLPMPRTVKAAPTAARGDAPTVVVCDDDPSTVEVIAAILEEHGWRAVAAASGEEAVERALAERPQAILLDLLMPGMDGWETAAALKAHPQTAQIPVIILSVLSRLEADAVEGDVAAWLDKPVPEEQLARALATAVGAGRAGRVLVVEDDPDLAGVLTTTFEGHGVETLHAADGAQAIALSERTPPDLVVLDLCLPEVDGRQVFDRLRAHDRLRDVPVIVYTGMDLDDHERERLAGGENTEVLAKGQIPPTAVERRVLELLARVAPPPAEVRSDGEQARPARR